MALTRVERVDDALPIRHVLVSVWNKTGLKELVGALLDAEPEVVFYATGGTYAALAEFLPPGKSPVRISELTGQPEMQGGLVKTLDWKIYLGLLSETYNKAHREDLARTGAVAFDMTVVNLYPFGEVAARGGDLEELRSHIDIGGPAMLRASAKNFLRVAAVSDPQDYNEVIREFAANRGRLGLEFRFRLARRTFERTAAYDAAIASSLSRTLAINYRAEPG